MQLVLGDRARRKRYGDDLARWVAYGASPRGTIALDRCARAHAWLAGRDFVTPEDVHAIAADVLRHRVLLELRGRGRRRHVGQGDRRACCSSACRCREECGGQRRYRHLHARESTRRSPPSASQSHPESRSDTSAPRTNPTRRARRTDRAALRAHGASALRSRRSRAAMRRARFALSRARRRFTRIAHLSARRRYPPDGLARDRAHRQAAHQGVPGRARAKTCCSSSDCNPGMRFGTRVRFKSVQAARAAALLAWAAASAAIASARSASAAAQWRSQARRRRARRACACLRALRRLGRRSAGARARPCRCRRRCSARNAWRGPAAHDLC